MTTQLIRTNLFQILLVIILIATQQLNAQSSKQESQHNVQQLASVFDFDAVMVSVKFVGINELQPVDVVESGTTLNLTLVDGQNTFLGDTRVIEYLDFITGCRDISVQGSSQACELLGGAGLIGSATFECLGDRHIWIPPVPAVANCSNIRFSFPSFPFLVPRPSVRVNISYVIVTQFCSDVLVLDEPNTASGSYHAAEELSAFSNIANYANVTMTAGESIILKSGFIAPKGSSVTMLIQDCFMDSGQMPNTIIPTAMTLDNDKNNEFSSSGWQVYPNPTSDIVNISTNGKTILTILDYVGRTISSTNFDTNTEIDLATLQSGIYWFVMKDSKGNTTSKKVIKQ